MKTKDDVDIARVIEQNNIDLFLFAGELGGKTVLREPNITCVISKPFWPNFLLEPKFEPNNIERRLKALAILIQQYKRPPYLKFGPLGEPDDLPNLLLASGFEDTPYMPPCMAVDLTTLSLPKMAAGLTIREVCEEEDLAAWISMMPIFEIDMFRKLIKTDQLSLFIGLSGLKPIAISMQFLSSGVAGIYEVHVDAPYRRRGYGRAMTMAIMKKAAALGYTYCVLQASEMGEPLYLQLGFKTYFRYRYFRWPTVTYEEYAKS